MPTTPPKVLKAANRSCSAVAVDAMAIVSADDDGRMAEREKEADADRPLALLHQLAGDVVDGGDVVGVDRVAQAEAVGQERRAEQHRIGVEGENAQAQAPKLAADQQRVDGERPAARR